MTMSVYLVVKVVHILSVISWMAGMLYLPRLFVYHSTVPPESESSALFTVMERRLQNGIMTPAMIMTWMTGLWMAGSAGFFTDVWLVCKMALVLLMSAGHGFLSRERKAFGAGERLHTQRFYRIINEVPTLLMIFIVALAVLKPF
ncbi:protoporphyrinogen oxidase HemJ [Roseiarcaceae bacterium H3SJ34-1]|uniref:protoporphyrinogen oxidase HemJ n=1 Tax=Terripilifer ovatus TaxID=3032367 RepID=UPI003AB995D5|nr:protoporphyrinogen oxidase HemJ [Roseiarcaceae bacterium H3SJ34-1]